MKFAIFGLTLSSSWGNGHATLWRGLIRGLTRLGCRVVFFERDVPYYAGARDLTEISGCELVLYESWEAIRRRAASEVGECDVAIVTSYCLDAITATTLVTDIQPPMSVFYDLDTPVTLAEIGAGKPVSYIGPRLLRDFDLVLSFTGGRALEELRDRLGARRTFALYGHVDPDVHRPVSPVDHYQADLSYLGTYASDRQPALEALFVEPARQRPSQRFLMGGAQYPHGFPWCGNIYFVRHLPPAEHPAFFSSSRLTLNVTRSAMRSMGWCPSGRLFEAAACGTAIVTDEWEGLASFFTPGREVLAVRNTEDVLEALDLSDAEIRRIRIAARERALAEHTSHNRALDLLAAVGAADLRAASSAGKTGRQRQTDVQKAS